MQSALRNLADESKAAGLQRFFKTGKGEYGEGDLFIGVTMPLIRQVVRQFAFRNQQLLTLDQWRNEVEKLCESAVHEDRMCAFLMCVDLWENGREEDEKKCAIDIYLKKIEWLNNWDLVDVTCYKILGPYTLQVGCEMLKEFAKSASLWKRRISIVTTMFYLKKRKETFLTVEMAKMLLKDEHDLIHKAVGWLLREMGKVESKQLISFLDEFAAVMPRVMLRYSLEKLPANKRAFYMNKQKKKIETLKK